MIRRILFLLALTLLAANQASAIKLSFYHQVNLAADNDASGGPSCGDELGISVVYVDEDGMGNRSDFTDLVVSVPIPDGVSVVPGTFLSVHGQESTCSVVSGNSPGDREARVECPLLCSSGLPNCTQNGGVLAGRVRIDDPNSTTSASFRATFDSNELGPVLSYDIAAGSGSGATVVSFPACPALRPAAVYALMDDSLAVDADGDGQADPGDVVRYTTTIANAGDELARDVRLVSDPPLHGELVVGSVTVSFGAAVVRGNSPGDASVEVDLGTIARSYPKVVTYDVVVDPAVPPSVAQIASQGVVSSLNGGNGVTDDPGTSVRDDPTRTPLDFDVDLGVTKTARPATVPAGGLLTWEINIVNRGTAPADGVVVTETVPEHTVFRAAGSTSGWDCADGVPAGTVCSLAVVDLPPDAALPVDFVTRVDGVLPAGAESTVNRVAVTDNGASGPDADPTDNQASATAQLDASPVLEVRKSGPASVAAGEVAVFTVEYGNAGDQAATGVRLVETVPEHMQFAEATSTPGWSCADGAPAGTVCVLDRGTVVAGAGGSVAFAAQMVAPVPAGVEIVRNTVRAERDDGDDSPSGPGPEDEVATPVDAVPDLVMLKDGPASARPGEVVVFQVVFRNVGDQDAAGVVLRETVPGPGVFDAAGSTAGWSCADGAPGGTGCSLTVGDLAGGASGAASFAVRLPATLPARAERLVNVVVVEDDGAGGADPTPGDNSDDAETVLDAAPDLRVTKSDGDAVAVRGGVVTYAFVVENAGDQDALDVVLTDTLPEHTIFEPALSTPGWVCSGGPGVVCGLTFGSLAAGDAAPGVSLSLRVAEDVPAAVEELVNHASVADDGTSGPDRDISDNEASETTPLQADDEPPPPPPERASLAATLVDVVTDDADGDGLPAPGEVVAYAALVRNLGPAAARDVVLRVEPDRFTVLQSGSVTTTRGQVASGNGNGDAELLVELGEVPAGGSATVTFEVRVATDLPDGVGRVLAQGELTGTNAASTVTDDPDTRVPLDPTVTDLDRDDDGEIADVPTLSAVGLVLLVVLLSVLALGRLRRPADGRPA